VFSDFLIHTNMHTDNMTDFHA